MRIVYACPFWGLERVSLAEKCQRIKAAGYDAVESAVPFGAERAPFIQCLADHGLQLVAQQYTQGHTLDEHLSSLRAQIENALPAKPLLINVHAGKDWWPLVDNIRLAQALVALSQEFKVAVPTEIHRGRMTFSTTQTLAILDAVPGLQLTADFSHWCCVAESDLADQQEAVARAARSAVHIHARVGHGEGPQVSDPRAPEWAGQVKNHLSWWDQIRAARSAAGAKIMTVTPEFGPDPYLPTLPYTRQPVASQWDINCYMMALLKQRWA